MTILSGYADKRAGWAEDPMARDLSVTLSRRRGGTEYGAALLCDLRPDMLHDIHEVTHLQYI